MKGLRIVFVGHFLYNSGSSNALLGYARAARERGHEVRISPLGLVDDIVPTQVPFAEHASRPDLMVIIFESYQYLADHALEAIERAVPRSRRLVVDQDGKASQPVVAGPDINHANAESPSYWRHLYDRLSDRTLQPALGTPADGCRRFLFFGMDSRRQLGQQRRIPKVYDLAYIGNNWYRWWDLLWLLEALAPRRARLNRIALFGKWWNGKPLQGLEPFTFSDPALLRRYRVEVHPSVSFGSVERAMSYARLNPVLVRPTLNLLKFATPRMFETFAADTVPVLPPYFTHAATLYGPSIYPLRLPDQPSDTILSILEDYERFRQLASDIASDLERRHSYERRLEELLDLAF